MVATPSSEVGEHCTQDALNVKAAMLVEALVLSGEKRLNQALGDGATRHIDAPLARELGNKLAIICMDSRQHGRLIFGEPLVVRQVLGDLPEDETHSTRPGEKHDGADRDHETKETPQEAATPPRRFQRLFGSSNIQFEPVMPAEPHLSVVFKHAKSDPELERSPAQNPALEWWLNFAPRPLWVMRGHWSADQRCPLHP